MPYKMGLEFYNQTTSKYYYLLDKFYVYEFFCFACITNDKFIMVY